MWTRPGRCVDQVLPEDAQVVGGTMARRTDVDAVKPSKRSNLGTILVPMEQLLNLNVL
jgi:hypothetical protein